jgi:hypothetical protein
MNQQNEFDELVPPPQKPAYEPPMIEETITPEEMEREVHYAGDGTGPG